MMLCGLKDFSQEQIKSFSQVLQFHESNHDELILFTKNFKCAIVKENNEIFNSSEV